MFAAGRELGNSPIPSYPAGSAGPHTGRDSAVRTRVDREHAIDGGSPGYEGRAVLDGVASLAVRRTVNQMAAAMIMTIVASEV